MCVPRPFPLGEAVRVPPGIHVELERVVPTDQGPLPYVRIESDDPDGFVAALRVQPAVASLDALDRHDSTVLLRVRWTGGESVVRWLGEADVVLLEPGLRRRGVATPRCEYGVVEAFDAYCRERGTPFELRRLYEPSSGAAVPDPEVTETQREALRLAYEAGYYEEPRETTLGELAAELGVGERARLAPAPPQRPKPPRRHVRGTGPASGDA